MSLPEAFSLDGKIALVTGAGSGLGIEFAEAVAEAGGDVVCADVNLTSAEQTATRVEKHGRRALALAVDVSDEQQVGAMVADAVRTFGRLDVLFNNAGVADADPAPIHSMTSEAWHHVINVDLHACSTALGKL
jgi:NAD(P)-dependent dehydrogenase (short-subunit alcohol dehydrogenase family)